MWWIVVAAWVGYLLGVNYARREHGRARGAREPVAKPERQPVRVPDHPAPPEAPVGADEVFELAPYLVEGDVPDEPPAPREPALPPHLAASSAGTPGEMPGVTPVDCDRAECTLFAPSEVARGRNFALQVFVSPTDPLAVGDAQALGTDIALGGTLSFELLLPGLHVTPTVQELTWDGAAALVEFTTLVPHDFRPARIHGRLFVSQDMVPIGRLRFELVVDGHTTSEPRAVGEALRFRQAFLAAALHDESVAAERAAMLDTVGMSYNLDDLRLGAREDQTEALGQRLAECEVMLLFWSDWTRESETARRQWNEALRLKGEDFIWPIPMDLGEVGNPPVELADVRFGNAVPYLLPLDEQYF